MFTQANQTAQQPRISFDATGADLSDTMAPVTGGGLHIQFGYMRLNTVEGDPVTRLVVTKQPIGDARTIVSRFITEEAAAREFPMQFAQFKATGEMPTTGTPLSDLPGISMQQIGLLYAHNIRSVEDLAGLETGQLTQIGNRDVQRAAKVAESWLKRRNENGDITEMAKREADMEGRMAEMQRQLETANRQLIEMQAKMSVYAEMGGRMAGQGEMAPSMAAMANLQSNGAIAIEGDPVSVKPDGQDLFEGGMADVGNADLGLDTPTPKDPLGIERRNKR